MTMSASEMGSHRVHQLSLMSTATFLDGATFDEWARAFAMALPALARAAAWLPGLRRPHPPQTHLADPVSAVEDMPLPAWWTPRHPAFILGVGVCLGATIVLVAVARAPH